MKDKDGTSPASVNVANEKISLDDRFAEVDSALPLETRVAQALMAVFKDLFDAEPNIRATALELQLMENVHLPENVAQYASAQPIFQDLGKHVHHEKTETRREQAKKSGNRRLALSLGFVYSAILRDLKKLDADLSLANKLSMAMKEENDSIESKAPLNEATLNTRILLRNELQKLLVMFQYNQTTQTDLITEYSAFLKLRWSNPAEKDSAQAGEETKFETFLSNHIKKLGEIKEKLGNFKNDFVDWVAGGTIFSAKESSSIYYEGHKRFFKINKRCIEDDDFNRFYLVSSKLRETLRALAKNLAEKKELPEIQRLIEKINELQNEGLDGKTSTECFVELFAALCKNQQELNNKINAQGENLVAEYNIACETSETLRDFAYKVSHEPHKKMIPSLLLKIKGDLQAYITENEHLSFKHGENRMRQARTAFDAWQIEDTSTRLIEVYKKLLEVQKEMRDEDQAYKISSPSLGIFTTGCRLYNLLENARAELFEYAKENLDSKNVENNTFYTIKNAKQSFREELEKINGNYSNVFEKIWCSFIKAIEKFAQHIASGFAAPSA